MNICNNSGLAVLVAICVNIDNTVSYTHTSQYIYIYIYILVLIFMVIDGTNVFGISMGIYRLNAGQYTST